MNIQSYLQKCRYRVERVLKKRLPSANKEPKLLHKAMIYSVLNGGKRLRAALVYAAGNALGTKQTILDDIAAAIECIHSYTLIHDDLPALDNDDLRRGKPTCHKVFGESTAILAGDALQTLAFEIITNIKSVSPTKKLQMISQLSQLIGSFGLIGGEQLDLQMVNKNGSVKKLENIYLLKTATLIRASLILAALASPRKNIHIIKSLNKFGEYIGSAFQIHDDIIGIESDTETLGKKQGADIMMQKPVYPALVGITKAKEREQVLYKKAINELDKLNIDFTLIKAIASFIICRDH